LLQATIEPVLRDPAFKKKKLKQKTMRKQILIICIAALSITSCNAQQENKVPDKTINPSIKQIEWLQGSWKGMYKNAPFYEAWRKATDSVMVNFLIEIKGTDTIVKENGAILLMKQKRGYSSTNASWQLESLSDDKIVLKNDTLKYANRIIWSHSSNDHWLTEIRSPTGTIYYDLERVTWPEEYVNRFIRDAGKQ
jgi:hypothetical protein